MDISLTWFLILVPFVQIFGKALIAEPTRASGKSLNCSHFDTSYFTNAIKQQYQRMKTNSNSNLNFSKFNDSITILHNTRVHPREPVRNQ